MVLPQVLKNKTAYYLTLEFDLVFEFNNTINK